VLNVPAEFRESMSSVKPLIWFGVVLLLVIIYGVLSSGSE
jgi:hypothetical protein